jgi:hypothetical protein
MVMVALDQVMLPVFLIVMQKLTVRQQATGSGLSEIETMLPVVIEPVLVVVLADSEVEDVEEIMVVVVLVNSVLVDSVV